MTHPDPAKAVMTDLESFRALLLEPAFLSKLANALMDAPFEPATEAPKPTSDRPCANCSWSEAEHVGNTKQCPSMGHVTTFVPCEPESPKPVQPFSAADAEVHKTPLLDALDRRQRDEAIALIREIDRDCDLRMKPHHSRPVQAVRERIAAFLSRFPHPMDTDIIAPAPVEQVESGKSVVVDILQEHRVTSLKSQLAASQERVRELEGQLGTHKRDLKCALEWFPVHDELNRLLSIEKPDCSPQFALSQWEESIRAKDAEIGRLKGEIEREQRITSEVSDALMEDHQGDIEHMLAVGMLGKATTVIGKGRLEQLHKAESDLAATREENGRLAREKCACKYEDGHYTTLCGAHQREIAEAVEKHSPWIPLSERLPTEGDAYFGSVLVGNDCGDGPDVRIVQWDQTEDYDFWMNLRHLPRIPESTYHVPPLPAAAASDVTCRFMIDPKTLEVVPFPPPLDLAKERLVPGETRARTAGGLVVEFVSNFLHGSAAPPRRVIYNWSDTSQQKHGQWYGTYENGQATSNRIEVNGVDPRDIIAILPAGEPKP